MIPGPPLIEILIKHIEDGTAEFGLFSKCFLKKTTRKDKNRQEKETKENKGKEKTLQSTYYIVFSVNCYIKAM